MLDVGVISETLSGKRRAPEESPPPFNEVQPAGPRRQGLLLDAGMCGQPVADGTAGVAGEIVVDQVEVPLRVRRVEIREEAQKPCRVPGRRREGMDLPILWP